MPNMMNCDHPVKCCYKYHIVGENDDKSKCKS